MSTSMHFVSTVRPAYIPLTPATSCCEMFRVCCIWWATEQINPHMRYRTITYVEIHWKIKWRLLLDIGDLIQIQNFGGINRMPPNPRCGRFNSDTGLWGDSSNADESRLIAKIVY
jgi:hypothetical protein